MSSLGLLRLRNAQVERLGLTAYQRLSPLLEKCCLRLSANESYQKAESEIEALMGVKVNHSPFQRLVQRPEVEFPTARQTVSQLRVDGGKVRVRTPVRGQKCEWFEYKSARVESIYDGATFQANLDLTDWLNTQPLGSLKRIKQAEAWLWQGCIDEAKALFQDCQLDPARKFCHYLERHRHRIVNDAYFQAEGSPIGSGAVESSIKQIDHRMKLTGAPWKSQNVPRALSVRCAYLNAQLSF
jgi:hypothetical protein